MLETRFKKVTLTQSPVVALQLRTVLDLSCASDVTNLNQTGKSDRLECARHRGGRGAPASGSASAAALSLVRPAPPCRGGHRGSGAVHGARRGANLLRFRVRVEVRARARARAIVSRRGADRGARRAATVALG